MLDGGGAVACGSDGSVAAVADWVNAGGGAATVWAFCRTPLDGVWLERPMTYAYGFEGPLVLVAHGRGGALSVLGEGFRFGIRSRRRRVTTRGDVFSFLEKQPHWVEVFQA